MVVVEVVVVGVEGEEGSGGVVVTEIRFLQVATDGPEPSTAAVTALYWVAAPVGVQTTR